MKWAQVLWKGKKGNSIILEYGNDNDSDDHRQTSSGSKKQTPTGNQTTTNSWCRMTGPTQNWGMTSLGVGNEGRVTGMGEEWDCGRRGLGYLSIVCTPCRRRVFNSTPRAGLGFLRDSNIQQLSVSEAAFKYLQSWQVEFDRKPYIYCKPLCSTAFLFFILTTQCSPQAVSTASSRQSSVLSTNSNRTGVCKVTMPIEGSGGGGWAVSEKVGLTWSTFPGWAAAPAESFPLPEYAGRQTPPACRCLAAAASSWKLTGTAEEPTCTILFTHFYLQASSRGERILVT